MKELPASQVYRLLEPGPIVMVSTLDNGRPNVMTMGFHRRCHVVRGLTVDG